MKALALCLMLFASFPLLAQGLATQVTAGQASDEAAQQVELSEERVTELISTLENEQARADFIANLKTLAAVQEQQQGGDPQVSELFNLDETSSSLLKAFAGTLDRFATEDSGLNQLLLLLVVSLGILLVLVFNLWISRFLDRKLRGLRSRMHLHPARFSIFFSLQRWFGAVFSILLFVYAVAELYGPWAAFEDSELSLTALAQYCLAILVVSLTFAAVWEAVNAFMEYGSYASPQLRRPRMQTLLPIVRNVLLCALFVLATLVVMSELGIEIMPLLAGAGIVGIAFGFGAQTVVRDFLNGFIIIFEDLMQVGDVVRVGGRIGLVEKITIRKVQLRDLDGAVYTVPFSEITIVDNLTKEYSYYLMDIGVSYRENVDEVIDCIREVLEGMRQDEDLRDMILEPLEVMGVDKFADSAVVIRARIKTTPCDQWTVGREFNRRMKYAFDERNIEIPFPHQTVYFGQDKDGSAPHAQIDLHHSERGKLPRSSTRRDVEPVS